MMTVRKANEADIEWMLAECEKFSQFYGSKLSLLSSMDFARQSLRTLITEQFVAVSEKEGEPTGFIAGILVPHFLNPEITVFNELLWWVREEHRNSRAGLLLLNAFTEFGKANADWMLCTLEVHSPLNDKHLIKRGFRKQETSYLMEMI